MADQKEEVAKPAKKYDYNELIKYEKAETYSGFGKFELL